MLAVNISGIIAWCAVPRQVLNHVQNALNTARTQIHPIALLDKDEIVEYVQLQKEIQDLNITGRYLQK